MTHHSLSNPEGVRAEQAAPDRDTYTFRAPRHDDLAPCPSCRVPDPFCLACGGEGVVFRANLEMIGEMQ